MQSRIAAAQRILADVRDSQLSAGTPASAANADPRAAARRAFEAEARIVALRALELVLLDPCAPGRVAHPDRPNDIQAAQVAEAWLAKIGTRLVPLFPCGDRPADRELALLIAYTRPDGAAAAIWKQLQAEPSRIEKIWLAYCLRCLKDGFTAESRVELARLLERGIADWSGGFSFEGYLRYMRDDVDLLLTDAERAQLKSEAAAAKAAPAPIVANAAEPRDFDKTLVGVERTLHAPRRSLADGALVFHDQCSRCHKKGEDGKGLGPDLTTAGGRFTLPDLLESMLLPSKTISDQYRSIDVFTKSGDALTGLPLLDDGKKLVLLQSSGEQVELRSDAIDTRRTSKKSVMPDGLLDPLTLEQIADLCAFLLSNEPVAPPAAPSWRTLFDGATLTGFEGDVQRFRVENGVLAGLADATSAAALAWKEPCADFVLEYDVRLGAPQQDFGLLFRGRRGADGRLVGYQADAGKEYWGSLREEGLRGMLQQVRFEIWHALPELSGWNHFVVTAEGDHLVIELNGVVTVDLHDPKGARSGLLAFDMPPGGEVRLRNVRLRTLPPAAAPSR